MKRASNILPDWWSWPSRPKFGPNSSEYQSHKGTKNMKCAFLGSWADNISSFCSFYYMGISKQIPFMGGKENSTTYNGYFFLHWASDFSNPEMFWNTFDFVGSFCLKMIRKCRRRNKNCFLTVSRKVIIQLESLRLELF